MSRPNPGTALSRLLNDDDLRRNGVRAEARLLGRPRGPGQDAPHGPGTSPHGPGNTTAPGP
ncbi:hypothetical protein [Streptomyces bottropensis]|uniref:Uncharacterized protein n=1 Tax=Streptomyces bottropensis ATCC 25435 TaxID=1054862 RepID=M3DD68_9ACTN|nr:hypothetical protein SBD_4041 [Streptomyces bottropensis ATCC 25435]